MELNANILSLEQLLQYDERNIQNRITYKRISWNLSASLLPRDFSRLIFFHSTLFSYTSFGTFMTKFVIKYVRSFFSKECNQSDDLVSSHKVNFFTKEKCIMIFFTKNLKNSQLIRSIFNELELVIDGLPFTNP